MRSSALCGTRRRGQEGVVVRGPRRRGRGRPAGRRRPRRPRPRTRAQAAGSSRPCESDQPHHELAQVGLQRGVGDLGPHRVDVVGDDHRARPQRRAARASRGGYRRRPARSRRASRCGTPSTKVGTQFCRWASSPMPCRVASASTGGSSSRGVLVEEAPAPRPAGRRRPRVAAKRSTSSATTGRPVTGDDGVQAPTRAPRARPGRAGRSGRSGRSRRGRGRRPPGQTAGRAGGLGHEQHPVPPGSSASSRSSSARQRRTVAGAGDRDGPPGRGDLDVERQLEVAAPAAVRPGSSSVRSAAVGVAVELPVQRDEEHRRRPGRRSGRGDPVGLPGVHRRHRVACRGRGRPRRAGAEQRGRRRRRCGRRAGPPTKPTSTLGRLQVVGEQVGHAPAEPGPGARVQVVPLGGERLEARPQPLVAGRGAGAGERVRGRCPRRRARRA